MESPKSGFHSKGKVVGKPSRVLLAEAEAPDSAKPSTWIRSFVTDPVYGGFSMNVFADLFVRILVCIATFLWFRRARKRDRISTDLEVQKQLAELSERSRFLESKFGLLQAGASSGAAKNHAKEQSNVSQSSEPGLCSPTLLQGENSGSLSASASTAVPTVSKNEVGDRPSSHENSGLAPTATSSSPCVPTESEPTVPGVPDGKKRKKGLRKLNGYTLKPLRDAGGKDFHVIDVPISCSFISPTDIGQGDKFKESVKRKLGVAFGHDVFSSRILQARVPGTDENLAALRDVAVEGMKLDKHFTLQIEASFLYHCTGNREEPAFLSLRQVAVPTILQVEYSAGLLLVRGNNLEGAEIRAATSEGFMIFSSVKQDPVDISVRTSDLWGTLSSTMRGSSTSNKQIFP